jgi:hypothetical protein
MTFSGTWREVRVGIEGGGREDGRRRLERFAGREWAFGDWRAHMEIGRSQWAIP